ncbi:MAG: hypothetical protein WCN98_15810, partial [Verrucomicrobiaceae bacterium]
SAIVINREETFTPSAPIVEPLTPSAPPVLVRSNPEPVVTISNHRNTDISGPATQSSPLTTPTQPSSIRSGSDKTLIAQSVPSLPGFVRSPYTNPPRLVDVKGAVPGSTMICPYTQRPFLIPSDFVGSGSTPGLVINHAPVTVPSPAPEKHDLAVVAEKKELPVKAPVNNTPASSVFGPAPTKDSNPPAVVATTSTQTKPVLQPKPAVTDIPLGLPIAGRPGFVNSPFAAKNQLVDVTGLPPGMEVKCPYTGKVFRVPGRDYTEQKGATIFASPEKLDKK